MLLRRLIRAPLVAFAREFDARRKDRIESTGRAGAADAKGSLHPTIPALETTLAMRNHRHPAAILTLAWSTVRLDTIRAAVRTVIADLCKRDRLDLLARTYSSTTTPLSVDPVTAALAACCEELRVECGITRAAGEPIHPHDSAWQVEYSTALDGYRDEAGRALHRALGQA